MESDLIFSLSNALPFFSILYVNQTTWEQKCVNIRIENFGDHLEICLGLLPTTSVLAFVMQSCEACLHEVRVL